jgi:hypothetical protein
VFVAMIKISLGKDYTRATVKKSNAGFSLYEKPAFLLPIPFFGV